MDLSNMLVQAVTANSVDGDYWGFTRQSDEESSSEGKRENFESCLCLKWDIPSHHQASIDTRSRIMCLLSGCDQGKFLTCSASFY